MTEIQTTVLVLLRASLFRMPAEPPLTLTDKQIDEVFSIAFAHTVGGFVYDGAVVSSLNIEPGIREMATGHVLSLFASYQLLKGVLFEILDRFDADNVKTVVYKGFSVALRYSTPELRSMHDIDLFVPESDFNTASLCLLSLGFEAEKAVSIHHISFKRGGYIVELHNSLFPFAEIPRLDQAILQADITAPEHIRTIMVEAAAYRYLMSIRLYARCFCTR